jgi:hypothetical protein
VSDEFSREYIRDVVAIAVDMIEDVLKSDAVQGKGLPMGAKRATDADMEKVWQEKMAQYPPQPMILPTGESVFESPWVLCVQQAVNGGEWLKKFKKLFQEAEDGA